jgi:hypothetical protein
LDIDVIGHSAVGHLSAALEAEIYSSRNGTEDLLGDEQARSSASNSDTLADLSY